MKMRTMIFSIVLFQLISTVYSQELSINKIEVSNIYKNMKNKSLEISEDNSKGPYVKIDFQITNDSNKIIYLSPSKSQVKIIFHYDNKKYENINYEHILQEIDSVNLKPNESFNYTIYDFLIGGTDLLKDKKFNYIVETLKLLPTLKVSYSEMNCDNLLISKSIRNIEILDKDLINLKE